MTAQDAVLGRWRAGAISCEVALAQLLLTGEVPDVATLPEPIAELARMHADRLSPLAALARAGFDVEGPDGAAALFDRLAAEAPEAGVAFYTFGDPTLMAAATRELADVVRAMVEVDGRDVLDVGCGGGRLALALAPIARSVTGVDVSAGMIARAKQAGTRLPNLAFRQTDGRTLPAADASADIAIAADSLPFVVQTGDAAVEALFMELARVLRPGGDLLVFNWSYRGDPERDATDAHALAQRHGFDLLAANGSPFAIWDGRAFHLRRR